MRGGGGGEGWSAGEEGGRGEADSGFGPLWRWWIQIPGSQVGGFPWGKWIQDPGLRLQGVDPGSGGDSGSRGRWTGVST